MGSPIMTFLGRLPILVLCLAVGSCSGLYNRSQPRLTVPHLETYWESWDEWRHDDFAANLSEVRVGPLGSTQGVNVVNLAFARPGYVGCWELPTEEERDNCVLLPGYQGSEESLVEGIRHVHRNNGLVKIAIGGETYGNPTPLQRRASYLVETMDEYKLDGIDFTAIQWDNMDQSGTADMIKELREATDKIISLTFPCCPVCFRTLLEMAHPYLDYITPFCTVNAGNIDQLVSDFGIPKHKIIWGYPLWADCLMKTTLEAGTSVREEGLAGVATWSINIDTAQRGDNEYGECNNYQTGHQDGAYTDMLAFLLNG